METKTPEQTRTPEPMTQERMQSLMESRQPQLRAKTWRPVSGGILSIVAGYVNILLGFVGLYGGLAGITFLGLASITSGVGIGLGIAFLALGAVSVIGGIYSLARRGYGMAVIGSIASLFPSPAALLGAVSLVFVGLGRNEFHRS